MVSGVNGVTTVNLIIAGTLGVISYRTIYLGWSHAAPLERKKPVTLGYWHSTPLECMT